MSSPPSGLQETHSMILPFSRCSKTAPRELRCMYTVTPLAAAPTR